MDPFPHTNLAKKLQFLVTRTTIKEEEEIINPKWLSLFDREMNF